MKYINLLKLAIILFGLSMLLSCKRENDIKVLFQNENQKEFFRNIMVYNDYNIETFDNGNYFIIKSPKMELIFKIHNILKMKMDIIAENIANVNTTMTEKGVPYKRKYISITVDSGVQTIEDIKNYPRLVYEPSHPDAIKSGERQGYVEYPNINIETEKADMIEASRQYEAIFEYIKNNYKDVLIL